MQTAYCPRCHLNWPTDGSRACRNSYCPKTYEAEVALTELIKQQFDGKTQRKDCFLCSAAMALGWSYEGAWNKLDDSLRDALSSGRGPVGDQCDKILIALGCDRVQVGARSGNPTTEPGDYFVLYIRPENASLGFVRNILWGRRALVQVRSKNYADEMHIIYWNGRELFDPTNARAYEWTEVEPLYLWLFDEASPSVQVKQTTRILAEAEG